LSAVRRECVRDARECLRRSLRPIAPRKRWAEDGGVSVVPSPNEDGVALCIYGDPGWRREVGRATREPGGFSKARVAASVGAIGDRWRPEPAPEWVTAIPTRGRSSIVGDFAAAVAAHPGLP